MSLKIALFKNTVFNLLGYGYLLIVSFFSISIFLANLGRDQFGVYLFLASFVPIASVFDFGISLAAIRSLAAPNTSTQDKLKIWQTSLTIFIAQALLLVAVFSLTLLYLFNSMDLLANFDQGQVIPTIIVLSLTIFINHLNNIFLSIPQANQRFDVFNSKTLLVGSGNTIFSAILTFKSGDLSHLFLLQLFFHLVTFFYILSYSRKIFGWQVLVPRYNLRVGKDLLVFGLKNFIGTLAGQIEAQASKFYLGFLSTAQAITSFNIPQSITMKAAGAVSQLAQAFFPLSASLLEKERILKLKKLYLGLQLAIFGAGLVAVFLTTAYGDNFLLWWLRDPVIVDTAFPVFKIMSLYFVLIALTPLPTALIQGLGKPHIASGFAVLTTVLEIILMSFLIPRYHEIGAALAFFTTILITAPAFLITTSVIFENQIKKTLSPV